MVDHIILNDTETGYLKGDIPQFGKTYIRAMSFHWPEGLAAVRDETGAHHIDCQGCPRYTARFKESCGFYEGIAAVKDKDGWFHIRPDASPVHQRRFRWSGNFQGGRCVVLGHEGFYHIDTQGAEVYPQRFLYAGDYRYRIAVVLSTEGAFHIGLDGSRLNSSTYCHAEPFHKGIALVADNDGFYHVNKHGHPIHSLRLLRAEPFYNGVSLCKDRDGKLIRLRENGTWTRIAETTEPFHLSEIKRQLGDGAKIGFFLRHAERHPITPETPDWGNAVLLNQQGMETARRFGTHLAEGGNLGFWASPIERCNQTCAAMAQGAGIKSPQITPHTNLGDPGIYLDGTGNHEESMREDFSAYATMYLDEGTALGTRPMPEASEELLSFLLNKMAPWDCTIFITHDFFAAALMSYLGLKAPDKDDWCDYLEGVCLIINATGVTFRRFLGQKEVTSC